MKNLIKRFNNLAFFIFLLCICTSFSINVFANEKAGTGDATEKIAVNSYALPADRVNPNGDELIGIHYQIMRGYEPPSKTGAQNLTENPLIFSGYASRTADTLYTKTCFYGKTSATITVNNNSTGDLKVVIYKKGIISSKVKTVTVIARTGTQISLSDLKGSSYYYIGFTPVLMPLDFDGNVK